MRKMLVLAVAAMLIMSGAFLVGKLQAQAKPTPGPAKIAVCDVVEIFNNYTKTKEATGQFKKKGEAVVKESDRRQEQLSALKMELDGLKTGSKQYDATQQQIIKLSIENRAWLTVQEEMAKAEHHRMSKELYSDVLKQVEAAAKDMGYDLVLFKEPATFNSTTTEELLENIARRKILYASEQLDITKDILTRLNDAYQEGHK